LSTTTLTPFGPTGQIVYERTYSRVKPNGERETWPETVVRVATGNLALVYGPPETWSPEVQYEFERLTSYMNRFAILPAGRHLWASGVKGRQYLFNCHVAGWGEKLSDHFEFTFLRLMEGGGVGANYSSRFLQPYGAPRRKLRVHIVCDPQHPDFEDMLAAGVLSEEYDADWAGAFEVEDSREGWADALVDLLDTFMSDAPVAHENRVYDVSRVRCKGSRLKTFGGTASGPQPFGQMMLDIAETMSGAADLGVPHLEPTEAMDIDHAIAACVVSGGNRRSARMSIVHWSDPFIANFLASKSDPSKNWTTNISVEIDDLFIQAITEGEAEWGGAHRRAHEVHRAVVTGMLTNGEPGYWNSDLSNVGEPNRVEATNPCGEIALEAWENCNLGHVNLDAFAPTAERKTDYLGLLEAHRLVTRFLIRATYGDVNDPGQAEKLARNRRIGVGHLGVQGFHAKRGVRYSDVPKDRSARNLLRELYEAVRGEARAYAFQLRIPEPVKVSTVAPTGSIAKLPGVTEGGHSIMFRHYNRRVRFSLADPDQAATVEQARLDGFEVETCIYDSSGNTAVVTYPTKELLVEQVEALGLDPEIVQASDELSIEDMLSFQALYQECWADNAVSFTVNVAPEAHQQEAMLADPEAPVLPPTPERVSEVAATLLPFLSRLKGTTLMVNGTRRQAPYEKITRAEYELAQAVMVADGTDENCATGACPVR
jgi:ribonucleoside-triphosphate reductase